jgi:limonene-1,2-epoxide hydrolase
MTDDTIRHGHGHGGARRGVARLLDAIQSRDLRAISAALHPDATWQNVPHRAAEGRDAIIEMLAPIITWSDRVRWDIVSESYDHDTAWLERADRFWIDGSEHTVRCNGVVTTAGGIVLGVRDYSDLGEWRERIGPVYERLTRRSALEVVQRHLDAVASRDPVAMAADYAPGAVLERVDDTFAGHGAIAGYFDTVPGRLGAATLTFGDIEVSPEAVTVAWRITLRGVVLASGRDRYVVERGRITHQVVMLDGSDF